MKPRKPEVWPRGALAVLLTLASATSCLFDARERCGAHQVYDSAGARCVCDSTYVLSGSGCAACGEHEVGTADGCVCEDGFFRATPDAACAENTALGAACATDADCPDPSYGHCQPSAHGAGAGYCTSTACTAGASECPGDYACNTRSEPSFCEAPPSGIGTACATGADCAGLEANYCEAVSSQSCLVNECKADPNKCFGDWVCCDIGLLSQSLCLPPSALEDGACPAGGSLIPRGTP
jgi:hypothetical protein